MGVQRIREREAKNVERLASLPGGGVRRPMLFRGGFPGKIPKNFCGPSQGRHI